MRPIFALALAYVLVTRVMELALSARNVRRILARGGERVPDDGLRPILAVHVLWILALVAEESYTEPAAWTAPVRAAAGVLFAASELLRLACIVTLGERWNVRVVVLPGAPPVRRGLYRWLRHPNYLAVVAGLASLPLALGHPWTAVLCVPLKLLALRRRIAVEDRAVWGPANGTAGYNRRPASHPAQEER